MKKKITLFLIVLISIFSLTGCVSEKDRNSILKALEKKNYIESNWELIDTNYNDASPIPDISSYEYIYKDKEDKLHMVYIPNKKEGVYNVIIYHDVKIISKEKNPRYGQVNYTVDEYITEYSTNSNKEKIIVKENNFVIFSNWEAKEKK